MVTKRAGLGTDHPVSNPCALLGLFNVTRSSFLIWKMRINTTSSTFLELILGLKEVMYITWTLVQRRWPQTAGRSNDGCEAAGNGGADDNDNSDGDFTACFRCACELGKDKRALPASSYNMEQYEYLSLSHVREKSATEGKDTDMMGIFLFMVTPGGYQESPTVMPAFLSTCKIIIWKLEVSSDGLIIVKLFSIVKKETRRRIITKWAHFLHSSIASVPTWLVVFAWVPGHWLQDCPPWGPQLTPFVAPGLLPLKK